MKTFIAFRLRKELDADLIGMDISEEQLPELCRNGLRLMLGLRTAKTIQVVEQPIAVQQPRAIPVVGKSAVFRPQKAR